MTSKELLKLAYKDGWRLDRINGSHHILIKGDKTVSIPVHSTDIKVGLLKALLKQMDLKL